MDLPLIKTDFVYGLYGSLMPLYMLGLMVFSQSAIAGICDVLLLQSQNKQMTKFYFSLFLM